MIPNFLIVGAARSGTSYLFKNLSEHPEIFMPKKGELHFFDRHFSKGVRYYSEFFNNVDNEKHKAIGEKTPAYLYFEDIPEKIYNLIPEAKIIIIIRNPVTRAYSHYRNLVAKKRIDISMNFREALQSDIRLIEEGKYADKIEKYFQFFGKPSVKVIIYENLIANPVNGFREIYNFLQVDSDFVSKRIHFKVNDSKGKLGKWKALRYLSFAFNKIKFYKLSEKLKDFNKVDSNVSVFLDEDKHFLKNEFKECNKKLEEMLNADLSVWNISN